ncbi:MAG TPA: glycosyltransferase family 2 protein [bacterium]|nr:glycosyltransferase family 2 protein [bacterium]
MKEENLKLEELTIFFPFYNEEQNIENVVETATEKLRKYVDFDYLEMILVNDGSKDKTGELADKLSKKYSFIKVIHHNINKGYGAALISGYTNATKKYIFYTDGDGQFDIDEIKLLIPYLKDYDVITGYRKKRIDPTHRLVIAFFFNLLMKIVFKVKVRDVDCAFKLIKKDVLKDIHLESQGAFIDAELLIKAGKQNFKIIEVGVTHYPRKFGEATGSNLLVITRAFFEILYNFYYFYLKK